MKEIGTDLISTLLEEDHGMLAQLKKIQVEEFASKVESKMEVVAKVSPEHQKLQSLLKDNIMKRRQELLNEGVPAEGDARRHGRV
jgi:vacuolar-type H+-ATPase subunit E/Vma4